MNSVAPPIHVLFIIYDLDRGGPEMRLLDLAENVPYDIRIFICVTSTNLSLIDRFKRCNVVIEVIPITKSYLKFKRIWDVIKSVRRNRIGIINTYDLKGLLIAMFIKLFSGRHVTLIHNIVDQLNNYSLKHKIAFRLLLKMVYGVVSNFSEAKELLGKGLFPEGKIELIHNGVDIAKFSKSQVPCLTLKSSLGIPEEAIVIGTVANFRKEKEYPFLLCVFKRLLELYPQLRLLCVGGGLLLDETKQLAVELGVADRTILTGYVENVPDYIAIMNVFVICGSNEGFPNALIQAMSMEVPVIVTDVGESSKIVDDDRDGYLYAPGDLENFISKICTVIENPQTSLEIARRGKEKVYDRYTLERMVGHYMDYFRKVSQKRDQFRPDEVTELK